jgi:hypothetical protein
MVYLLAFALAVFMGLTLYSLLRGLNAFRQSHDANMSAEAVREMQLKQNRMMWARIKYQAIAVFVIALLLMFTR